MSTAVKILIVDDNDLIRKTVRMILEKAGYTGLSEAKDGAQALSTLKNGRYNLLVSDWNMPIMDGITLLRMVRGDAGLKDLPVLMVTAEAEKAHVVEAIKVGITDYIVKPFSEETLVAKVQRILAGK